MNNALTWISLGILISGVVSAQGETKAPGGNHGSEQITPHDVYERVALVRGELELIRLEMGRPSVGQSPIEVTNAAPREVFFQAVTLFRKSDRLAFEQTRERTPESPHPEKDIQPAHVLAMVDSALGRIRRVKDALGITESPRVEPTAAAIDPSHVFNLIVTANREINKLLDQQFSPADVYQQVSVGIAYLSRLLDTAEEVSTPPKPPPLERRKRPPDVYGKLIDCYQEVREIGIASGHSMLDLKVDRKAMGNMEPSDVYDIASLLVSELLYLHGHRKDAVPPRKVYNPGRKFPSHVYQQVGILRSQIDILKERVALNPDWLKG